MIPLHFLPKHKKGAVPIISLESSEHHIRETNACDFV